LSSFVFQIADEHKAVLLADMAHISGLVAAQVSMQYILLDVLVCSIVFFFFLRVVLYFDEPVGWVKIQTTSKNIKQYYTPKHLVRDLLFNGCSQ